MKNKDKNKEKEKSVIEKLIKKEREIDERSFLKKAYCDTIHTLKVLLERFSPIN